VKKRAKKIKKDFDTFCKTFFEQVDILQLSFIKEAVR